MKKKDWEKKLEDLFLTALNNRLFTGAVFSYSTFENGAYGKKSNCYGYAEYEHQKKVTNDSVFDLASCTKALATAPLILILIQQNKIKFNTEIGEICPLFDGDSARITISQLLSHSAGFAAHRNYFPHLLQLPLQERKNYLLKTIAKEELQYRPGTKCCYSDLGFMLLGLLIEKISDTELGLFAMQQLYKPLKLEKDLFFAVGNEKEQKNFVSTGKCTWSGKSLNGFVHDENCRALGGNAGHAGLFGTQRGVLTMCEYFLDQWMGRHEHPNYRNALLQEILEPVKRFGRTLGFDMVSKKGSSAGNYFSNRSVGHLGYTGTSFWIDPEKQCIAVLLTNRVFFSEDRESIKNFRINFHNILMKNSNYYR